MSVPYKECALVVITFFKTCFMTKINMLCQVLYPYSASVILIVKFANSFEHFKKNHNHTLQPNPQHCEEEPKNTTRIPIKRSVLSSFYNHFD